MRPGTKLRVLLCLPAIITGSFILKLTPIGAFNQDLYVAKGLIQAAVAGILLEVGARLYLAWKPLGPNSGSDPPPTDLDLGSDSEDLPPIY